MIEVLKQAYQLLLTEPHAPTVCNQLEVILRQAIAELGSQEPVAWMHQNKFTGKTTIIWDLGLATPNQNWKPLYTHPPQRTWVGLTDEEAQWIYDNGRTPSGMMEMVEAKLKEKNT